MQHRLLQEVKRKVLNTGWFSSLTGYAHFLYTGRFFLIPVGTIIFILAVVAAILKINAVNQLYFKKVGNEENELF